MEASESSNWIDSRDQQSYRTLRLKDGRVWLAENLRYNSATSIAFGPRAANDLAVRGRLYDWETAVSVCPPGWRLPTTAEWRNLINAHGGYNNAATDLVELGFDLNPTGAWDDDYCWSDKACFWTGSRPFSLTRLLPGVQEKYPAAHAFFVRYAGAPNAQFFEEGELRRFCLAVRCVQA